MHGMSSFKRVQHWLTYTRQWHLLDAKWQDPELLAKKIAVVLRGMNKPIFHHRNHVIVYNCRHIALKGFDWKRREYYFDNRYPRGKASIPAFEIHRVDPCRIMFLEVYSALGGAHDLHTRRRNIERLHLLADDVIPEHLMKNVSNQLEQVMRVPKRYDEYTEEERKAIPALFDWPEDFTITVMEEETSEGEKKPNGQT
uniref:39S ribosomal protein L13, mitochondrial n=1 Tax=Trichuris muris TaxID=70415 RepID=A0A5S6QK73_TRIMR